MCYKVRYIVYSLKRSKGQQMNMHTHMYLMVIILCVLYVMIVTELLKFTGTRAIILLCKQEGIAAIAS